MDRALPRLDRPIVLIGPMGAGKTSVGAKLARRLGLAFADSDVEIEKLDGRSIGEIFDGSGESYFRDWERRTIAKLIDGPPKVIAAGGGAFIDDRTRALILSRCIAVWLDSDAATAAQRIGHAGHRPLLRGGDPQKVLEQLSARRNPVYAQAHLRVSNDESVETAVERVVEALCGRVGA